MFIIHIQHFLISGNGGMFFMYICAYSNAVQLSILYRNYTSQNEELGITNLPLKIKIEELGMVVHACHPSCSEGRRVTIQGQSREKLARIYLNKQTGHTGTCLSPQLHGRISVLAGSYQINKHGKALSER
jgi:hypothetical protein